MESSNKVYERLDPHTDRSEANAIPQRMPLPTQYLQFMQPDYQIPGYYHHSQMPVMMPYQYVQQPIPQSNQNLPPFNPALMQYPPMQIQPTILVPLDTLTQQYEKEIQKHKRIVTLNKVMIALQTIVFIFGATFAIAAFSSMDLLCDIPDHYDEGSLSDYGYDRSDCVDFFDDLGGVIVFILVPFVILVFCLLISIHKKAILAYQKRQADAMENVMICFGILFVFNALCFNCIGLALYGYLTYAAYQLKKAFTELNKIEDLKAAERLNAVPTHQMLQMGRAESHSAL